MVWLSVAIAAPTLSLELQVEWEGPLPGAEVIVTGACVTEQPRCAVTDENGHVDIPVDHAATCTYTVEQPALWRHRFSTDSVMNGTRRTQVVPYWHTELPILTCQAQWCSTCGEQRYRRLRAYLEQVQTLPTTCGSRYWERVQGQPAWRWRGPRRAQVHR